MSTARGRLWKRLVDSGRWDRETVIAKLGSQPKKQEMLDACEALGVEAPDRATNPEIHSLLQSS